MASGTVTSAPHSSHRSRQHLKKVMVVLAALVVAVWAAGAWSQGGPGQGGRGGRGGPGGPGGMMASCPAMAVMPMHGPMIDRLVQDLGLTEDQVTQLKDVTAKGDAAMLPLAKKAGDATKALRDAVYAADYSEQTADDERTGTGTRDGSWRSGWPWWTSAG
jgi:Spy/CpxP family protein refolding chaperone